jgi:DNA-directed RNA polymerase specialized sigma24 family protein
MPAHVTTCLSQTGPLERLKGMSPEFPPRRDRPPTPSERVWSEFLFVLEELPPGARAAFLLHDVFAASHADIAVALGIPLDECRRHVELARTRAHARARGTLDRRSRP